MGDPGFMATVDPTSKTVRESLADALDVAAVKRLLPVCNQDARASKRPRGSKYTSDLE
jgi:hypothetical protein